MKRLSYVLLCSAVLAFASASPAENPAGEPEAETLAVAAEGFDVLVPVPDGWIRIDDLEAETPVPQGYRRLAVLAPKGVTQRTKMGIPSTVVEVLLYLETATTPVSAQTFAAARDLLMDKFVGREESDNLTLSPDDPYRPGHPWREHDDRWCCAGCLLPPGSVFYGNPMNVFLSQATGAVLVRGAVVQIEFTKNPSNEEEDAKLRDEAVRYLREFVALNPVAEAENAVRTFSELVQRSDRNVKGNPLPTSNGEASESHGKTDAMIRAFVAFVGTVLGLLVLLKFRKMILWKYSRFDDFKWDGQSDIPKTNLKPGHGSK